MKRKILATLLCLISISSMAQTDSTLFKGKITNKEYDAKSAFDGMQPTLRHVPPSVGYFSIIAVLKPNCAQRIADTYPPGP